MWGSYTIVYILSVMKEIIIEIKIIHMGKNFHLFLKMCPLCARLYFRDPELSGEHDCVPALMNFEFY